ncbi:hypothetical protein PP298_08045 [Mycobacteroides abscessus]|uniref:hypothetical protein n=1 Tax=Mycobacteroides abscessus TaxID=36809 RepID=UPI00078B4AFF|nr:hypothetical protein [Mycobacteroides abscessus]AMU71449.1 hypothetical protein A3O05_16425 [Mycobacteroides abscessus]MDM2015292.1 hypothetical protein [Mycobacteroides abscessus]MDM2019670.1 hypothetical protein [Mycobacteroides abscessus]MDM2025121.1 hypothetical protein [Mycobacteroides abscessus]MDM2027792.1 hypothetical protein [Mycobacteroides abscessus]
MNIGQLIASLRKLDPDMPVVMEMTDEPPGDYEVSEVRVESYCRERKTDLPGSWRWPITWHDPEYAFGRCHPEQPIAYLSFNPPWKPTIDGEIDQSAIESTSSEGDE